MVNNPYEAPLSMVITHRSNFFRSYDIAMTSMNILLAIPVVILVTGAFLLRVSDLLTTFLLAASSFYINHYTVFVIIYLVVLLTPSTPARVACPRSKATDGAATCYVLCDLPIYLH